MEYVNQEDAPVVPTITANEARDALISCFADAHENILRGGIDITSNSNFNFENIKKSAASLLIKMYMKDLGGDFEHPTKEMLIATTEKLAEFAGKFRSKEVIKEHVDKMMGVFARIEE